MKNFTTKVRSSCVKTLFPPVIHPSSHKIKKSSEICQIRDPKHILQLFQETFSIQVYKHPWNTLGSTKFYFSTTWAHSFFVLFHSDFFQGFIKTTCSSVYVCPKNSKQLIFTQLLHHKIPPTTHPWVFLFFFKEI